MNNSNCDFNLNSIKQDWNNRDRNTLHRMPIAVHGQNIQKIQKKIIVTLQRHFAYQQSKHLGYPS